MARGFSFCQTGSFHVSAYKKPGKGRPLFEIKGFMVNLKSAEISAK